MSARSDSITTDSMGAGTFDFEQVFHAHYSKIARIIARIVQDTARAEELASDVFCKLLSTPRSHDTNVAGWLYRTAVRKGFDELRRQRRQEKYKPLLSFLGIVSSPEQTLAATEDQRHVRTVLATLKRRDSELLLLRSEGLSYEELAGILQVNETSIGTLLRRAQETFRKEYVKRYGSRTF